MRLTTLITTFIVSVFVLITVLTAVTVYYIVDGTFDAEQERFMQRQIHQIRSMLLDYIETRELLVADYAEFPQIRLGARYLESTGQVVKYFMDTIRLLGKKSAFVLLDRQGTLIYSTRDVPVFDMEKKERGRITIETWEDPEAVYCTISDTGPGTRDKKQVTSDRLRAISYQLRATSDKSI